MITLPGLPTTTDPTPVITQMVRRIPRQGLRRGGGVSNRWDAVLTRSSWSALALLGAGRWCGRAATTAEPPSARHARICTPVTPGSWCTPVPPVATTTCRSRSLLAHRCSPPDRAQLRHGAQRHRRALPPHIDESRKSLYSSATAVQRNSFHGRSDSGTALCGQCYDYFGHVPFTWHLPELWRRFTIALARRSSTVASTWDGPGFGTSEFRQGRRTASPCCPAHPRLDPPRPAVSTHHPQ